MDISKAQRLRLKILAMAQEENADSADLILAIADVLGDVAAMCDKLVGYQPIEKRLDLVVQRAKVAYGRATIGLNV